MSWVFFLAEKTVHQVMSVYGVPRDSPPHDLSFETMVLDDSAYAMGTFDAYMDTNRDYSTWFTKFSVGPIIKDVLVSGGRVLGSIIRAQVAIGVEWRACSKALEAKVTELKALLVTRELHM